MTNERIGWVFDAHLCPAQQEMIVWIISEDGSVFSFREAWMPILHVAGESKHLHHLLDWLWQRSPYEVRNSKLMRSKQNERNWVRKIDNICSL